MGTTASLENRRIIKNRPADNLPADSRVYGTKDLKKVLARVSLDTKTPFFCPVIGFVQFIEDFSKKGLDAFIAVAEIPGKKSSFLRSCSRQQSLNPWIRP